VRTCFVSMLNCLARFSPGIRRNCAACIFFHRPVTLANIESHETIALYKWQNSSLHEACERELRKDFQALPVGGWHQPWLAWAREHADRLDPMANGFLEREIERVILPGGSRGWFGWPSRVPERKGGDGDSEGVLFRGHEKKC